jgi:hypothetical protein
MESAEVPDIRPRTRSGLREVGTLEERFHHREHREHREETREAKKKTTPRRRERQDARRGKKDEQPRIAVLRDLLFELGEEIEGVERGEAVKVGFAELI